MESAVNVEGSNIGNRHTLRIARRVGANQNAAFVAGPDKTNAHRILD